MSAAPKIWRVSRRADRDIWKLGRLTEVASEPSLSSAAGKVQLKVVKRALSRKTMPGSRLEGELVMVRF